MFSEDLQSAKRLSLEYLDKQRQILDDLDELGVIMDEMLQRQRQVEVGIASHPLSLITLIYIR